jgi:hypothetical protein
MAHSATHADTLNPSASQRHIYGLIAEFEDAHEIVHAANEVYDEGYRKMDAYTPLPVEGLPEALGFKDMYVPSMMLVAGIGGAFLGFFGLYYLLVYEYPMNIGGRPIFPWPMYLPITFELTVLCAALTGIFGMFAINGLPQPYHPVFDAPNFDRATSDRFFLCIEAKDPQFDLDETRRFLEGLGASRVSEVELRK